MLVIGMAACLVNVPTVCAEGEVAIRERDLNVPIVCGTQDSYYPYSYLDNEKGLQGFAIDLTEAVAREMKLKIKWLPLVSNTVGEALLSGQSDAIPFWGETKSRRTSMDFSMPILRFETVIVARKDFTDIRGLSDLKGLKVGVGPKGTVGEQCMREQQPDAIFVYAPSTEELVRQLATGGCDAVVMSRLTAVMVISRFNLNNVHIVTGVPGYDVRYCLTVRKGEALLLARFNEGLAVLNRTGEFNTIYQKWFGRYERQALTPLHVISYVAGALALIAIGAMWGFLRQRALLRRIAHQAAELAEQRSLLAALFDKHPLATVVLDVPKQGEAKMVSLNQEATLLFGIERKDSANRALNELGLTKELHSYLAEAVTRYRASGRSERWEVQLLNTKRLLEVVTMPLGAMDEANRVCVLSADITRRRLMDQEIAKSRRLRALGELVGGIAHEFNNLLTPILATASMLRSAPQPAKVSSEELDIIDQAAHRAADLTKRLLAFGRKTDDPVRSVRLVDAVNNCEALLKTMMDRRIEWTHELPADLLPVAFNPTDFNQIVFNLVLNARDTLLEKLAKNSDSSWKPRLKISLSELPAGSHPPRHGASRDGVTGWQKFSVQDNGMGIPAEIIDRIFEPFYTTKEVGKGTGLGLSQVWHQVTDAGGDVEVETKLGEGTTFHVYLPCRESRPPMPVPAKKTMPPLPPPPAAQSHILVVEDEPLIASTAAKILERLGHTTSRQADGLKAWQDISANVGRYDLLLIDLSMPHMNGVDLVKHVRTIPYKGRIVVMSGRVSDEDLRVLKELQVDRLMGKPFTTDQLMANVSDLLASHKT